MEGKIEGLAQQWDTIQIDLKNHNFNDRLQNIIVINEIMISCKTCVRNVPSGLKERKLHV